jgi:hypothetical protein
MERDHVRAGKRARARGAAGELEVRDLLHEYGYARAHRNFMSGGAGGGDMADAIPDVHLEVKFVQTLQLATAWRQACAGARPTDMVLVVHRNNNAPWAATGLLTDLHSLIQHLPMAPVVIGARSPRTVFLAEHKLTLSTRRPMVVHQTAGEAMATVLFRDWLSVWAPVDVEGVAV